MAHYCASACAGLVVATFIIALVFSRPFRKSLLRCITKRGEIERICLSAAKQPCEDFHHFRLFWASLSNSRTLASTKAALYVNPEPDWLASSVLSLKQIPANSPAVPPLRRFSVDFTVLYSLEKWAKESAARAYSSTNVADEESVRHRFLLFSCAFFVVSSYSSGIFSCQDVLGGEDD